MVIDSHAHVSLPIADYLSIMDEAGIDRAVLFATSVHPEAAEGPDAFGAEMGRLTGVVLAGTTSLEARTVAMAELAETVERHPGRFCGFCSVPAGLSREETCRWIEGFGPCRGIGEVTVPPGGAGGMRGIFEAASDLGGLPVWVHTFVPLDAADLREVAGFARRHPAVPLILGHAGGLNWLEAIKLAREQRNVYLDLSATYTRFTPLYAARELPDRVLFSSDYPYGDPYAIKVGLERVIPDGSVRERVMGGTMLGLLEGKRP